MDQSQVLTSEERPKKKTTKMNVTLWVLQVLLALLYLNAGYQKAFLPIEVIAPTIFWVIDVPAPLVRFIGVSELLGAIGLIVPTLTRIWPRLTVFSGAGIAVIMLNASLFHIWRGEFFVLPMTGALCALAAFIAYGRWKLVPVSSKS